MAVKLVFTIVTTITFMSSCSARVISQNAISSIVQDIMSPENTERALQIINMATSRGNRNKDMPAIVARSVDCGFPARAVIANEMPRRAFIARNELPGSDRIITNEMGIPRIVVTKDGVTRLISNEQSFSSPEIVYPAQQRLVATENSRNIITSPVLPKEIYSTVPFALPQISEPNPYRSITTASASLPNFPAASSAPNPYLPFGPPLDNPFLPVASPVSAMSSSCLPPPTQSRGQFLRKIPIPPPTI